MKYILRYGVLYPVAHNTFSIIYDTRIDDKALILQFHLLIG